MLRTRLKHLTIGISASLMLYSSAEAATISIGVTPSFADTLNDIVSSFQNYYIENGNLTYNVTVNIASDADIKANIINGGATGPYDLFLSQDTLALLELRFLHSSLVAGNPFPYAVGSLMLYSGLVNPVNISAGLPSSLTRDFVIPDPASDIYGKAALKLLALKPGFRVALRQGHVKTRDDVGSAFAAVDEGAFAYGFVAKAQICQYYGGAEHYIDGTYHHEYLPRWENYEPIVLRGLKIARTRAADQETELTDFINFLTGHGTALGTSIIKQYCYKLPD